MASDMTTVELEKHFINRNFSEEKARKLVDYIENYDREAQKQKDLLFETPEETIKIDKEIEWTLKSMDSKLLKDGSVVVYHDGVGRRSLRKDFLFNMLNNSKCVSCELKDLSDMNDYRVEYYQPVIESKGNMRMLTRMKPVGTKNYLTESVSYDTAITIIKMLNKENPNKEFFLENF